MNCITVWSLREIESPLLLFSNLHVLTLIVLTRIRFKVALESSKPMISSLKSKFELSKCWNLEHVGRRKPKKWHPLAKSWIFYEFYEFRESNYLRFRIPIKSKWKKKWNWRPIPWKNFVYNVWQEVLLVSRWDFEWKGCTLWNSQAPVHHIDPTETNHTATTYWYGP